MLRWPAELAARRRRRLERVLVALPPLEGKPITVRFRAELTSDGRVLRSGSMLGTPVHAASFLRRRRMLLDADLLKSASGLTRIVVHELFHFRWLRLGNALRRHWEELLRAEFGQRARGELGWSAEWRKQRLRRRDCRGRTRRWREYACESFCDTGAWLLAGAGHHEEHTLAARFRARRAAWFRHVLAAKRFWI